MHNGTNYDYHFIIKELAKKFNTQDFNRLDENMEKYITFKVPIKKMNEDGTILTHKLEFMDSYRFMARALSTIADNLSEINKCKCKSPSEQSIHTKRKNDILICRCKTCNNKSYISIDTLKERFPCLCKFSKGDKDKFILLLRKI